MLKKMTQEQADKFDAETGPDPKAENSDAAGANAFSVPLDRTHLNTYGQKVFGRIVADQPVRARVELGPDFLGERVNPGEGSPESQTTAPAGKP